MSDVSPAPHTILVHGLGRSRFDLLLLARRLGRLIPDTQVHLFDYHSRKQRLEDIARDLDSFVGRVSGGQPVSFVGHSLGGIVVRALDLQEQTSAPLRRLVTLGSPHGGARIARILHGYKPFRSVFGPVLGELGMLDLHPFPRQLQIGCLIGATGTRWGFLPFFGEDNDGVVLAKEATLLGSHASLTKAVLHAMFPFSSSVAHLSARFLTSGSFE